MLASSSCIECPVIVSATHCFNRQTMLGAATKLEPIANVRVFVVTLVHLVPS